MNIQTTDAAFKGKFPWVTGGSWGVDTNPQLNPSSPVFGAERNTASLGDAKDPAKMTDGPD
jgi:hypothetical protein